MGSESSYQPSITSYGTSATSGIPSSSRMSTDPSQASYAASTASYETSPAPGMVPSSRMTVDPSQASSATVRGNPMRVAVRTQKAPPPTSLESQAIICQGMVTCSGQIGVSPVRQSTKLLSLLFCDLSCKPCANTWEYFDCNLSNFARQKRTLKLLR